MQLKLIRQTHLTLKNNDVYNTINVKEKEKIYTYLGVRSWLHTGKDATS